MESLGRALLMIGAWLVMSGGNIQTGVADRLAFFIGSVSGDSRLRFFLVNLIAVTAVSAFLNNFAATAIFYADHAGRCQVRGPRRQASATR
jgi:Na+/H+ antiporter NhaD/arsenite permease-like protein